MKETQAAETYKIRITGLVQGVGFRPFVYRIAQKHHLTGTVDNRNDGVIIYINGLRQQAERFADDIKNQVPVAATIENITIEKVPFRDYTGFRIVKSNNNIVRDEITEISPDIAVCDACLTDMKAQPHRIDYPFINCTNCGPRFTIIRELPYDRPNTTMAPFKMCERCYGEYTDVSDRRFHAQPVACNHCGPHYRLHYSDGIIEDWNNLIKKTAELIESGETVALKGMGGYALLCDATDDRAVSALRKSKYRDGKPLAVMFRDLDTLKRFAVVNNKEEELLTSWRRPIVLLKIEGERLAGGISVGFGTVGALLPYMPFHYLLFEKTLCPAIVFTSANIAGEPIIIDNRKALDAFRDRIGAVITYNRDIQNRADDSVAFVAGNTARLIRRSRGYAPSPVRLGFTVDGILATGAELVNTFCIGRTNQAILSQHIGDLKNAETLEFFEESISRYQLLFKFKPKLAVSDLHPDYLSSKYAKGLNINRIEVQHHHAHMASCMAENRLNEKVIGIIFDGTGLGTDGNIWGGEFLTGDYKSFERFTRLGYIPLPGGDKVTKEPWRTALSYLIAAFDDDYANLDIPFVRNLDSEKADFITQMIKKDINCPLSSAAGRLFDAVSALLEVCTVSSFHAEAPMRLEDIISKEPVTGYYSYEIKDFIDVLPAVREIIKDIERGENKGVISAKFHNTLVALSVEVSRIIRDKTGINTVVLSGGAFQNRYLSSHLEQGLKDEGFRVFVHRKVPANDGGIALGQLAIAAHSKEFVKSN